MKGVAPCVLVGLLAGCAGGAGLSENSLAQMDRVRSSPGAREGQALAPQEYGHAEEERRLAMEASKAGDGVATTLYAERAMAAYEHALILARLARATEDLAAASAALQTAEAEAGTLAASRADVDREADELDKKLKITREAILPSPSGPADPAREAARLVAARALTTQGRLLCGAARLVSPALEGLAAAEKDVGDLEAQVSGTARPAPIDAAARARAACLALLTHARREADGAHAGDTDALLAELAASGGWEPSRDERGVVLTLRGAFKGTGTAIEADAAKKLAEVGRVSASHPAFAVQVVVHDAAAPSAQEAQLDAHRAEALAAAIVAGGAPAARVKAETAGARAPVVDPADPRRRERNARVEVVFVAPGN